MYKYIKNYIFWMPIALIILVELVFRLGLWDEMLKPNSHAGYSNQIKKIRSYDEVQWVTLGDSRSRIGINHSKLRAYQQEQHISHINLTMNRSYFTTFNAVTNWANKNLPNLEVVMMGIPKSAFTKLYYGKFELTKVQPFVNWNKVKKTDIYALYDRKVSLQENISNYSALYSYRADISDFIANPMRRINELSNQDKGFQNTYSNIGSNSNICSLELKSLQGCQDSIQAKWLELGQINTLKRYCGNSKNIKTLQDSNYYIPDKEFKVLVKQWVSYLNSLAEKGLKVVIVLMPEHSLILKNLAYLNQDELVNQILSKIDNKYISIINLTELFQHQKYPECTFFYEIIHSNFQGTEVITNEIIKSLSEKRY